MYKHFCRSTKRAQNVNLKKTPMAESAKYYLDLGAEDV